jgi:Transposase IS116/IS110/IS902 family
MRSRRGSPSPISKKEERIARPEPLGSWVRLSTKGKQRSLGEFWALVPGIWHPGSGSRDGKGPKKPAELVMSVLRLPLAPNQRQDRLLRWQDLRRAVTGVQARLRTEFSRILATRTDVLSPRMLRLIEDLASDWHCPDKRIEPLSDEIEALAHQESACDRLMTVPGVGPIVSSAMVAAIGTGDAFSKGRNFSAWLGLVPKQISTEDRTILGSISRRGNRYLRVLFVQTARGVPNKLGPKQWEHYGLKAWIEAAKKRLHHNMLAIAFANKLARIAWAVLNKGAGFGCVETESQCVSRAPLRPGLRERRAVLGPVKEWPGNARARPRPPRRPALTVSCARRASAPAGREEGTATRRKQRNCPFIRRLRMT